VSVIPNMAPRKRCIIDPAQCVTSQSKSFMLVPVHALYLIGHCPNSLDTGLLMVSWFVSRFCYNASPPHRGFTLVKTLFGTRAILSNEISTWLPEKESFFPTLLTCFRAVHMTLRPFVFCEEDIAVIYSADKKFLFGL
jgi:hypothetical protein